MSFYIRKSVKFGPIRFNISKSGIGVSTGVKGARIATGPSGTYIHLGRNGVYYRQKIDGSVSSNESSTPKNPNASNKSSFVNAESINADNLIESTYKDTVAQINSRIQQPAFAWVIGILSTILAGFIVLVAFAILISASSFLKNASPVFIMISLIIAASVWFLGIWVAWVTSQQEKLARITTLQYKLDEETKIKFTDVQNAFELLAKSAYIWRVISRMPTWDWKRNSGATSLINRKRIRVGYMQPPFIQTRIKIYGLSLDTIQLFFLPDQVLIRQNGKYGAINYLSLNINVSPTRFIEEEGVPHDSQIVDSTWRYVRKDGGPDGRFKNNRQIPIVQYGYIELSSQTGLDLHFHISNLAYAQQFADTLLNYKRYSQIPNASSSRSESSAKSSQQDQAKRDQHEAYAPKEENAYAILNVPNDASWADIASAYKKMAQMYHPDKVAGLAPEYREIAEKRMKIINAAYDQLKRNHSK